MVAKKESGKKGIKRKQPETVRERVYGPKIEPKSKNTKIRPKLNRPISRLRRIAVKEFNPVKAPQNRWGKVLNKRFNFLPKFLINAWRELRQVRWPSRKDALKLTFAVIVFAAVFAIFVQVFGYFFEKLIKLILT